MKTIGIITEYNPFHYGHKYQLELAKKEFGASYIVTVMSGDFTQRGIPAITDKFQRAREAVFYGSDLVVELPVCYATADLPDFSLGSVAVLDRLGVIDNILFGSESGDLSCIREISETMSTDTYADEYKKAIQKGLSPSEARAEVVEAVRRDGKDYRSIVNNPNNLLGIQYLCALTKLSSRITPQTHLRKGQAYIDDKAPEISVSDGVPAYFASATAIRKKLLGVIADAGPYNTLSDSVNKLDCLIGYIPPYVLEGLKMNFGKTAPIFPNDFSVIIKNQLTTKKTDVLTQICGISADFARQIKKHIYEYIDYDSFCSILTRYENYTRICRRLFRIILEQEEKLIETFKNDQLVYYAHVLAHSSRSAPLINAIKQKSTMPLLFGDETEKCKLTGNALLQYENDRLAAGIYQSAVTDKYGRREL